MKITPRPEINIEWAVEVALFVSASGDVIMVEEG